ncbi:MAG: DUF2281 domain-containing protein [bacterium]
MEQSVLLHKIENLPDNLKQELSEFINYLLFKQINLADNNKNEKRNGFGCLKGKISIKDDFNAPIEEFREYM